MTMDVLSLLSANVLNTTADGAAPPDGPVNSEGGTPGALDFSAVFSQLMPATPEGQTLAGLEGGETEPATNSSENTLSQALDSTAAQAWLGQLAGFVPATPIATPSGEISLPSSTLSPSPGGLLGSPATTPPGFILTGEPIASIDASIHAAPETLRSTWLGQRMQVITPTEPAADLDEGSLMAFAQGQGLDEVAMARLFGPASGAALGEAVGINKGSLFPTAAWMVAGGRQPMGLVSTSEPVAVEPTFEDAPWALKVSILPPLMGRRHLEAPATTPSPPDARALGDDGRVEQDLDLGAALADLAPDADWQALKASEREALSLKLGEMLAQRMIAQAQRGQWQLRFAMNPQHLGRVEIDMQMRGGELEAVFAASNPLTRELLQEGLPKLREILQQLGMDVASVNIGSGGSFNRGGQSTPEQVDSDGKSRSTDGASQSTVVSSPGSVKAGDEGWDIWV